MGVILVVSPEYLEKVLQESKKFSFGLQGYGTFRKAVNGVMRINASDYLGFAYVANSMPSIHSKEYNYMLDFLTCCDLMQSNKKFVFVVAEGVSSAYLKKLKMFTHLRFFQSKKFDYMSDLIINNNLFGSILLDNYEPYKLTAASEQRQRSYTGNPLKYVPVINEAAALCVSKVDKLDTLQHTLENDAAYQMYCTSKSAMAALREYMVMCSFDLDCSAVREKAQKSVDTLASDASAWCLASSLLKYIDDLYIGKQVKYE